MAAYAQDLRDRVLRGLERGEGATSIANRLEVSLRWVYHVKDRYEKEGERAAQKLGGYRRSRVAAMEPRIRAWIGAQVDMTLAELRERLAEHGVTIKTTALWHQLDKWNLTLKKTLRASEQEREDVSQERAEWRETQPTLDVSKLVFIDETGANTQMTRPRGRSPKGERCQASIPGGHWNTTTFIAGLRVNEVTAPMTLDGPLDREAFLADVRHVLCPALRPGDIVIADNLGSHKSDGVRTAIEAVGASIRYRPPYSPDFNPIEMVFSKLKALLKKAALRTVDALGNEIGKLLDTFSPQECATYFNAAGYSCMAK